MSTRLQQSLSVSQANKQRYSSINNNVGVVIDVVLNDSDLDTSYEVEGVESLKTELIGCCLIRKINDSISSHGSLTYIKPYNTNDLDIPLKGEMVELINTGGGVYYKRLPSSEINIGNAEENRDIKIYDKDEESNSSSDYSTVSQTGISNSGDKSDRKTKLGKYFEYQQVNPLVLYEGDKIIQSRFGQSIRFSGYNNTEEEFSPTIIIRNRQNDESVNNLDAGSQTEEDVNKDGSTILLSSNKYKIDFQPGTVDDGGSTDFETNPINFELPQEYVDYDQMLLSSERIILSAKSQEMIFFSKGNYGFISDGKFTIDNGNGGADLDFGDDVNITTDRNNGNFSVITGTGNILLNTDNTNEAIVRGNTLVDLLTQLIDAINKQTFNTPSGPTALGPNNRADFNDIKSKLRDALSTLNYTE